MAFGNFSIPTYYCRSEYPSGVPSIQIRFTEVVLNYAEACMTLGQEAEAKKWINTVRFRVGMPAVTESGDALMARYRNERNIEMFLEDQRFYDVRRWMIAPQARQQAQIIIITGKLKPGKTVTTYKYSKDNYTYTTMYRIWVRVRKTGNG